MKNKKYDLMIGNPPYDRSLHLKIIDIAMQHLTDNEKKLIQERIKTIYWKNI